MTHCEQQEPRQSKEQLCPLDRLRQLEQLYLCGSALSPYSEAFSLETLIDTLVCLYDECCNSTLRKEKAIAEFVELGKIRFHLFSKFIQPNRLCPG